MGKSAITLGGLIVFMMAIHFLYYPKWNKQNTEATISWDVSGYYMYLPAAFIYKDIKKCAFKDDILTKYQPTSDFQQAFLHQGSGNYVMKYSLGQSIIMSPFFFIAHTWASATERYPADGFSFPYQFCIGVGMLLFGIFGLFILRLVLLEYFSEIATSLTLIGIVLGSNYLNYSAIDGAMTHSSLFTLYSLLLWATIRFYKQPSIVRSLFVGLLLGFLALIRPTEIIAFIIPLFWGVDTINWNSIITRLRDMLHQWKMYLIALVTLIAIGSLQLFYWHYATGDWIVYSYQDQGFSWLRPHILDGIFSYKTGWLIYSPMLVFSLIGFYHLHQKQRGVFYSCLIFTILFIYIAFAWDIWWYGGSLGQRTMVQSYPILAMPFAAFIDQSKSLTKYVKVAMIGIAGLFIYMNIWFTHQAHKGGLLHVAQMTKAYYWKTLLTYDRSQEELKLLDGVKEVYEGVPRNMTVVAFDTIMITELSARHQYSDTLTLAIDSKQLNKDWIRVSADIKLADKEWNYWSMTQFRVDLVKNEKLVEDYMIKLQRHLQDHEQKRIYMDIRIDDLDFDEVKITFWNADSHENVIVRHVYVEAFDE